MARLPDLEPRRGWSAAEFCHAVQAAAPEIVDDVHHARLDGRTGWSAHLTAYRWRQRGWQWRITKAAEHHAAFRRGASATAIDQVLGFGGMASLGCVVTAGAVSGIRALAEVDDGDWSHWTSIPGTRIASVSKIYAAADPERWSIYDSRVAAALTHLVGRYWDAHGGESLAELLRFPVPPHQPISGERKPAGGFKRHYPTPSRAPHARLAFVYASWLIRCMLTRLSELEEPPPPIREWQPLHIEMALFTLGRDTRIFTPTISSS